MDGNINCQTIARIVPEIGTSCRFLATGLVSGCVGTMPGPAGLTVAPGTSIDGNPAATISAGVVPDRAPPVAIGDELGFELSASEDTYGHLYLLTTSGRAFVLMENLPLPQGAQVKYPQSGTGLSFRAQPPAGVERVLLLVTRHRFTGFGQGATASGPVQLATSLRTFVSDLNAATRRLPKEDWTIVETHIEVIDQGKV